MNTVSSSISHTFISRRFSAIRALASSSDVMIFFPVELKAVASSPPLSAAELAAEGLFSRVGVLGGEDSF